ncbi:unnamed protein product [Phytophthora fragariaefolia]|uniref:Unnamed protein product n=1 Tax=Phytophthora fragariaefolia TaxID=1490495 RepID=A0A9W6XMX3_9STRA|nr:unnamed protein product [Phytophthora fragariaefolia]
MDPEVLEGERTSRRKMRYGSAILQDPSDPFYGLIKEFSDVVNDVPPSVLPPDQGSPHSSPTFCVRKPNGKWRMVHAFNELNAATIPASTPIPMKDVLQNNLPSCTVFSALDMVDDYYQPLMWESDIPLTAVSTSSGMLWEWLVMPQGLSNAPTTLNRLVTQLFMPIRHFVQTYFDDIFVHSRTSAEQTAVEVHLDHLREVLLCMQENHLYANINKCNFGAEEIPFLGCLLGKDSVRADPEKVSAIAQWSVPTSQTELREWLGLANYLHKYSANYAEMARPLTNLLKKDALWSWTTERQQAFEAIKRSLQSAPILALPDDDRPFSVATDDDLTGLLSAMASPDEAVDLTTQQRPRLHGYSVEEGLLYYQVDRDEEPRVVVPNDQDLPHRVLYKAHDTPLSAHLGRKKSYTSVARSFWWPHMYQWVRSYVQTCDTCQRVKPAPSASAPLASLPAPADCWRSVSVDFIFELPTDSRGHTDILIVVWRLSKMVRLAAVWKSVTAPQAAQLFVDNVFRHHGLPEAFVSDRDPRFVSRFWQHLFRLLCTRLDMSTADHPHTDGQTERLNHVQEDNLRSVCAAEPTSWGTLLHQVEFALNNAVDSLAGFTPFYLNGLRHPRIPLSLPPASNLDAGEAGAKDARGLRGLRPSVKRNLLSFIDTGEAVRQRVRDAMAAAHDRHKENSDRHGRANTHVFEVGDQVLLDTKNLPISAASAVGNTKLRHRFIGPFTVIGIHGHGYTLDLSSAMATHPAFYVGLFKPYYPAAVTDPVGSDLPSTDEGHSPPLPAVPPSQEQRLGRSAQRDPLGGARRDLPRSRPVSRASESTRDIRTRNAAPPRRPPCIATAGSSTDTARGQGGPPAQASPAHGAADDVSPQGHRGQPRRGIDGLKTAT